jgi:hypothetical protein
MTRMHQQAFGIIGPSTILRRTKWNYLKAQPRTPPSDSNKPSTTFSGEATVAHALRGHGLHHYHFRLSALSVDRLSLGSKPSCREVEREVRKHTIAEATLVGTYQRGGRNG